MPEPVLGSLPRCAAVVADYAFMQCGTWHVSNACSCKLHSKATLHAARSPHHGLPQSTSFSVKGFVPCHSSPAALLLLSSSQLWVSCCCTAAAAGGLVPLLLVCTTFACRSIEPSGCVTELGTALHTCIGTLGCKQSGPRCFFGVRRTVAYVKGGKVSL